MVRMLGWLSALALAGGAIGAALAANVHGSGAFSAPKKPALVAMDYSTGELVYWPIRRTGGTQPKVLSPPLAYSTGGLAGNGSIVAIANQYPAQVVGYDTATRATTTLDDPYGVPLDIAVDKNANVYVVNFAAPGNVTMFPAGSSGSKQLVCKYLNIGEAIAVDNEGDIFVNGYFTNGVAGVVEIPNGPSGPQPQDCTRLHLLPEPGYVAGVAIHPKTDDVIVLDNPDDCAGGIEGRMMIYRKPYRKNRVRTRDLNANCAGFLRLDATSSVVFVLDESVSGAYTFVLQRSYPGGLALGTYSGGNPGGFTTIPNTLPN